MFAISSSPVTTQLTFTCSKSTIETLEKGVKYVQTYVNFEHILHRYLVFLFSTLNKQMLAGFKLLDFVKSISHDL